MMFVEKGVGNGGLFARGCADICRHLVSEVDREVDVVDPVVNRYFWSWHVCSCNEGRRRRVRKMSITLVVVGEK